MKYLSRKIESDAEFEEHRKLNVGSVDYRTILNEIRRHTAEINKKSQGTTIPHWEGYFDTGRKINIARLASGEEKSMYRKVHTANVAQSSGVRIWIQLALLADEGVQKVVQRATAGMYLADKLKSEGYSVETIATWASTSQISYQTIGVVWTEVSEVSAEYLASIAEPEMFRSYVMPKVRGVHWSKQFNCHGGAGYTLRQPEAYKEALESSGLYMPGDIIMDWSLPIDEQIKSAVESLAE